MDFSAWFMIFGKRCIKIKGTNGVSRGGVVQPPRKLLNNHKIFINKSFSDEIVKK